MTIAGQDRPMVEVEEFGAVLEIRMAKPKVNAICRRLSQALARAATHLQESDHLRVGILTGIGDRAFSAGWDFNEAIASADDPDADDMGPGGFGGITALWSLNKPLIAAVNGPAIGGGFELALACDMVVMAEHAFFQLPEMQRGILPDGGGMQRLPHRLPYNVATGMIYTGRRMTADEALRWGLAHSVCPAAELGGQARALAAEVAKGAPLALQAFKEVMRSINAMPIVGAMAIHGASGPGFETYARMRRSLDAVEGPRAFLDRREPDFQGR